MIEEVSFKNNAGQLLRGNLHLPKDKTDKAVIFCHGFAGNKDRPHGIAICNDLAQAGFAALRFDFRGNGQSEGKFKDSYYSNEISDLKSAIDFLIEKGYKTIGTIGHSKGGAVVVIEGNQDDRVKAVVSIAPVGYPAKMKNRMLKKEELEKVMKGEPVSKMRKNIMFTYTKEYIEDLDKQNTVEAAKKLKGALLVIHGDSDATIPVQEGVDVYEAASQPKQMIVIKGGDHGFKNPGHEKAMITHSVKWMQQWLK